MATRKNKKNKKLVQRPAKVFPKYGKGEFELENNSYTHRMNLMEDEFDKNFHVMNRLSNHHSKFEYFL